MRKFNSTSIRFSFGILATGLAGFSAGCSHSDSGAAVQPGASVIRSQPGSPKTDSPLTTQNADDNDPTPNPNPYPSAAPSPAPIQIVSAVIPGPAPAGCHPVASLNVSSDFRFAVELPQESPGANASSEDPFIDAILWDALSGRKVKALPHYTSGGVQKNFESIEFSASGEQVVGLFPGGPIRIWETRTADWKKDLSLASVKDPALAGQQISYSKPILSADGKWLAAKYSVFRASRASQYGVAIWNVVTGAVTNRFPEVDPEAFALSPAGDQLFYLTQEAGSTYLTARPANGGQGVIKRKLDLLATSLALSANGKILALGDGNALVRFLQVGIVNGVAHLTFSHETKLPDSPYSNDTSFLGFSWDSSRLVIESGTGMIGHHLLASRQGGGLKTSDSTHLASVSRDGTQVALWSESGAVSFHDLGTGKQTRATVCGK